MNKIKVGLVYGGRSVEHDISVISATSINKEIDRSHHDVILIGINEKGQWFLMDEVSKEYHKGTPLSLALDADQPHFLAGEQRIQVDVIFPILHGTDGEDGSVQGMFKAVNLPLVGSGVMGSSVAMNKLVSKQLFDRAGIPNAKYLHYSHSDADEISQDLVETKLGFPVIIKPVNLGSSVGVSKVNSKDDLTAGIREGFRYDNEIIIEEFIEGREIECAVLGNNPPVSTPPGEIIVTGDHEIYDFEAKYVDEKGSDLRIPAEIEIGIVEEVKSLAVKAFQVLGCADYARVDMFLKENGDVFINEINTIPGFTSISMFPKLWEFSGLSYSELITRMIDLALRRFDDEKRTETHFESRLN